MSKEDSVGAAPTEKPTVEDFVAARYGDAEALSKVLAYWQENPDIYASAVEDTQSGEELKDFHFPWAETPGE